MLKNHLKIAIRNLIRQKGLAFINIFGLSIGFACFCLFLLYTVHEFSFDRFHDDNERLFRMYRYTETINDNAPEGDPHLPMPLGPALKTDFPDVEAVVRWKEAWGKTFVKVNGKTSRAEVSHVDANVFDVFTFPLKYGNLTTALADPKNIVLTEKVALQLFGESNPTGKILEIQIEEEFLPFTVTAIAKNLPSNSSKQFQIMGSMEYLASTNFGKRRADNWRNSFLSVFVKLREGSGLANNEESLQQFRNKYYPNLEKNLREKGYWTGEGAPVTYRLQPFRDMHINTEIYGGDIPAVNPKNVWLLLAIAAGVLLIAIINFTTLSIGRSAGRAKEVGVRKVIGSNRYSLIRQFMTEAMLLSVISVVMGLGLVQLLIPFFNELSDRSLSFSLHQFPELGGLIIGVTLIAGLLAGSYPALMLSGFKPIEVLKNKIKLGGANLFTKSLVTVQFALSSALIIATIVILHQLDFLRSQNPGFNKENVIVIDAEGIDTRKIYPLFKNALAKDTKIRSIAAADISLGANTGYSQSGFDYKGTVKEVYEYYIDDDYLDLMGLELLTGRGFEPNRQDGVIRSVVVNESMVKDFGWTIEEAIGQELTGYFNEGIQPKVIGVIADFNFRSLEVAIAPQMFHQFDDYEPHKFFVRINAGDPALALTKIGEQWASIVPEYPFKYSFLDEDLNQFYRAEERYSQIVGWAGGLSIFLACLGLMGLAALAAVNRTKEIGIRKVLGANVLSIIKLLSKDFIKLVLLATLIAAPISAYFMNEWLQSFAYRIEIEWWVFAITGAFALVLTFLTIGFQSLKTALANPINSLKSE